jgi:hypothetical protein
MRYWIVEYRVGKNGKGRRYGVDVEPNGVRVDKGIYDSYQEAVEVIHAMRREQRLKEETK